MKRWIIVAALLAGMIGAYQWTSETKTEPTRKEVVKPPASPPEKQATMTPGRVVELHTTKGQIDFVLFEKDCPVTTKRIADLVTKGSYNGIEFNRIVPRRLIQTGPAKGNKSLERIGREFADGLIHTKGTVGMARMDDPNSATSVFYILIEPMPWLNYEYTSFGRLIRGMDVVISIRKGDIIKSAKLRPFTDLDKKALNEVLKTESERRVN
ncbi:MAG: peptidylprolyl isomerase [Armatimonadota bacterium]|nr:peptidylprolyl isomerase [bacterium]